MGRRRIVRLTTCELAGCGEEFGYETRPPRYCGNCRREIVQEAEQADWWRTTCVVCGGSISARSRKRTCSSSCRMYLSRLRRDAGLL